MTCRLTRILTWFWPAFLTFIASFSLLTYLLQPRPTEIVHFHGDANVYAEKFIFSPDDQYLLSANGELNLIDLKSRQLLLSIPHTNDQYAFDSKGEFVWIELKKLDYLLDEGVLISLWRFDPVTRKKVKLLESMNRIIDGSGGRDEFKGLHELGLYHEHALLSPNGKMLLLPRYSTSTATFDLIDTVTGQVMASLDLPPIQLNATYSRLVEAAFSSNGQTLLIQTEDREKDNTHYRLRLFDTQTGKENATLQLPGAESLGSSTSGWEGRFHGFDRTTSLWQNKTRLGKVLHLEDQRVVAVWTHVDDNYDESRRGIMLVDFKTGTVHKTVLDEFQLSQETQKQHGRHEGKQIFPELDSYRYPPRSAVISIAQYQESVQYDRRQGDRYLPLLGISQRSLKDGSLLHRSQFTFPDLDRETILERNELLAMLPDNKVLIKQTNSLQAGQSTLRKWIDKIQDWLHLSLNWHLLVIDVETGKCEVRLTLKNQIKTAHVLSNGRTLVLVGHDDGSLFLQKYHYPLHKPWLHILSWAVSVAIVVQIIFECNRVRRRWQSNVSKRFIVQA